MGPFGRALASANLLFCAASTTFEICCCCCCCLLACWFAPDPGGLPGFLFTCIGGCCCCCCCCICSFGRPFSMFIFLLPLCRRMMISLEEESLEDSGRTCDVWLLLMFAALLLAPLTIVPLVRVVAAADEVEGTGDFGRYSLESLVLLLLWLTLLPCFPQVPFIDGVLCDSEPPPFAPLDVPSPAETAVVVVVVFAFVCPFDIT